MYKETNNYNMAHQRVQLLFFIISAVVLYVQFKQFIKIIYQETKELDYEPEVYMSTCIYMTTSVFHFEEKKDRFQIVIDCACESCL